MSQSNELPDWMPTKIAEISVTGPLTISVTFNDGARGVFDFAELVGTDAPMTRPMSVQDYFERVFLEHGALTWPNGFDLCPDWTRTILEANGALSETARDTNSEVA